MLDLAKRIIVLADKTETLKPQVMLQHKIEREIDAQYLSADKAAARLGWRAEISLDEGLRRTIAWYREHLSRLEN
jgi:nucleoside-diphosphate-sugar epimerase